MQARVGTAQEPGTVVAPLSTLARREREVLALLVVRWSNAEIAARLAISPRTGETHVAHLLTKLGAANGREAAAIAARHGLI